MKVFKDFLRTSKNDLEKYIILRLKDGPVQITVDCTINSLEDMIRPDKALSIKRKYKNIANQAYQNAKKPDIFPLVPVTNQKINGFLLDFTIPLPVLATGLHEQKEYTEEMLSAGLFILLKKEREEYYLQVFKALHPTMENLSEDSIKMIEGTYWEEKYP